MLVDQLVQTITFVTQIEAGLALGFADEKEVCAPGVDSAGDDEHEDGFGVVRFVGFGVWEGFDGEVVGYVVDGHLAFTAVRVWVYI